MSTIDLLDFKALAMRNIKLGSRWNQVIQTYTMLWWPYLSILSGSAW